MNLWHLQNTSTLALTSSKFSTVKMTTVHFYDFISRMGFLNLQIAGFENESTIRRYRPYRLAVRTSRCGRDNPGSNPGMVNCLTNS